MADPAPIRLLLVEDSEDEAVLLYSELNARGMKVAFERVDTAPALEAALEGGEWDAILCDHNMPGFDSTAAHEVVRRSGRDIPFVIYSGRITDQQAVSAMREGVHDYIEKGNYARLMPVLERELRNAAARREVRQADVRLRELAGIDTLTGLLNQDGFCRRVAEWMADVRAGGGEPRAGVFYVDIDRFLRINNSFGYETGNEILRQAARRLAVALGGEATLARLSGDGFGVFVPGSDDADLLGEIADRLRGSFGEPFRRDSLELFLSASVGIAPLPGGGEDALALVANAEIAMGAAKSAGGNVARLFRSDMNPHSADRLTLESDLRHAIARGQLFLEFQPCLEASSGRVAGMEALVRWRHAERGLIRPDQFIPLADESGMINEIGNWVLQESCRQGRRLQELGFDAYVAVNVSAVQFGQPRLLAQVHRALADSGFAPNRLQLEITESVLMHDAESAVGMLRTLKGMGVKIAVDDFGTGYSSLSYLKRFPIDILKIDKSFVRDLPGDEEDAAISRLVIALARSLKLLTVAEGVEADAQVEFLRREGCDRFQGYFFARPMDAARLEAFLRAENRVKIQ